MTRPKHVDVLIIGAGISGIGVAAHLIKEKTGKSFAILERRQAMGGTWDVFRYPGIRSDSDMYTFGYGFHPWHGTKVLSDGAKIKQYVEETADHYGVAEHINFGKRVSTATWDSAVNRWTLAVVDEASGTSEEWTSRYLVAATGIFDQDTAYRPDFPGEEDFQGPIIHPQFWPEDFDYSGKRVVIIGSGATAVTLAPSMAPTAEHVTVLQRSPTYLVALPSEDPVTLAMRKARVPNAVIAKAARARWIAVNRGFFQLSKSRPEIAKRFLLGQARAHLGSKADMVHFTPKYEPWDQRLCVVPNGDLFKAIRRGDASIVTDTIKRFDETGILLESGEHLDADVVVAATGMNLRILGGVTVVVDGQRVELSERVLYKQALIEGVPNAVTIIGYTNISWTLKTDLISEYFVRLLKHMDRNGHERFEANASDADRSPDSLIGSALKSNYIKRADRFLPRQGTNGPWKSPLDYFVDVARLRYGAVDDGVIEFDGGRGRRRHPVSRAITLGAEPARRVLSEVTQIGK